MKPFSSVHLQRTTNCSSFQCPQVPVTLKTEGLSHPLLLLGSIYSLSARELLIYWSICLAPHSSLHRQNTGEQNVMPCYCSCDLHSAYLTSQKISFLPQLTGKIKNIDNSRGCSKPHRKCSSPSGAGPSLVFSFFLFSLIFGRCSECTKSKGKIGLQKKRILAFNLLQVV